MSLNREVAQRQDRAKTILASLGIDYIEIDGADPENKDARIELFEISGRPLQYPQFFLVEDVRETSFLGDMEEVEAINDASSLPQDVLQANPNVLTWDRVMTEQDNEIIFLMSSTPGNLKTMQRQQRAQMLLNARKLPYFCIDGAEPRHKQNRQTLFDISGCTQATYPQFFVSRNATRTTFLGDWETIEAITDATQLPEEVLEANPSILTWDKVLAA